ncbi:MAG: chemotaxis response regulator protein-glutamate methylesterase [Armatimonadetes bacterium]|nr:chemotaxis response regulator protein-glutamate methylesterase [Armatimonadota bacterium]MBS1725095.1 chemotaxis response regulator protein-glutamate methylesterase [Armatimonadota bacterium]
MTRVLVVDDSIFMRRVISDAINRESDMEVCGTASSGEEVLAKVRELKPDVVTLDIEMPRKNGLIALKELMSEAPTPAVMFSTLTSIGADATVLALEIGAVDFACKPEAITGESLSAIFQELIPKIRAASRAKFRPAPVRPAPVVRTPRTEMRAPTSQKTLLIASSTGGPKALMTLFESLPKNMTVPCVIVQHMPAGFTKSLAERLDRIGAFKVREANQEDALEPGVALMAPGGKHLELVNATKILLNDGPDRNGVKPCADYTFESAAKYIGANVLGVILTGMGRDGTAGALALKKAGATIFGESDQTCVVYGMPKAAKEAGATDGEFPIDQMGAAITAALSGGRRASA